TLHVLGHATSLSVVPHRPSPDEEKVFTEREVGRFAGPAHPSYFLHRGSSIAARPRTITRLIIVCRPPDGHPVGLRNRRAAFHGVGAPSLRKPAARAKRIGRAHVRMSSFRWM